MTAGETSHEAVSQSEGEQAGWSVTRGQTETLRSIREIMPTAVYPLEEEIHTAIVKLRDLPERTIVLKRISGPVTEVTIPEIRRGVASRRLIETFVATTRDQSPFIRPVAVVTAEIAQRAADLRLEHKPRDDGEGFWVED